MARHSDVDVSELRKRVTSPGGTTKAALDSFESDAFEDVVYRAVEAATRRGEELAQSGSANLRTESRGENK